MTTFIKLKLKKLDDETDINEYEEAAKITKYHIINAGFWVRIKEWPRFFHSTKLYQESLYRV